jgi:DNA ligase-1
MKHTAFDINRAPRSFKSLLLAETWKDGKFDPKGYYMSEKLDGVRAIWNGRSFYSRYGNAIMAPTSLTQLLPKDLILDGELFLGRQRFQQCVSAVKKLEPAEEEWASIRFITFDAPMMQLKYEERYNFLVKQLGVLEDLDSLNSSNSTTSSTPRVSTIKSIVCEGHEHLKQFLRDIESKGGEGVMLRAPGSMYEWKRSWTLAKVPLRL